MFEFLRELDEDLYKRYLDIESAYKTYSGGIYVSIQFYLENLLKYVVKNMDQNFYLESRETLGTLLNNNVLKNTLEIEFAIKNLNEASVINKKGNNYKHNVTSEFEKKEVINHIKYIYELSVKVNNYFFDNIEFNFDEEYFFRLENNTDELVKDYKQRAEEELKIKDNKIDILNKEKEILEEKYKRAKKDRDETNKENQKLKKLEADYIKKENELSDLRKQRMDYEMKVAENLDLEDKKSKEALNLEIKRLSEDLLKLKKEIKIKKEKDIEEYNTKINKFEVLLKEKDSEVEKLKIEIDNLKTNQKSDVFSNKIKAYEVIRKNRNELFFNNSYTKNDTNYVIYNLNDMNLSTSKYSSFYAVLYNFLLRGKLISKSKYLEDLNLEDVEYSKIIRLQMSILSLIRNNKLKDSEWKINLLREKQNLIEIAVNDILDRIKIYTSLAKIEFINPNLSLIASNEIEPEFINISFGAYDTNNNVYAIEDRYSESYSRLWIEKRIKYNVSSKDSKLLLKILHETFNFTDFKEGQLPILINVLNGNNTLGILPTGGGKSLIFQFCALMQPKLTLVIAPINSLIKDQTYKLKEVFGIIKISNITGGAVNKAEELKKFENMDSIFSFVSPERVQSEMFRNILIKHDNKEAIGLVVLDEVHCLSEWGHDFRISYLMLSHTLNNYCKNIQYLGLTATASINVVKDLRIELNIYSSKDIVFTKGLKRKNLNFKIIELQDENDMKNYMYDLILKNYNKRNDYDVSLNGENTNSMIVFMKTKKETENYYEYSSRTLEEEVERFNGDYKDSQDLFMKNQKSLLFATKAFGMGIDKPNVRSTIHFGIPSSREGFYQEAGRAGRDNNVAQCLLLTYKTPLEFRPYVDRFINQNTTVEELLKINEKIKFKTDVSTNFFFFLDGIDNPENEAIKAYLLYLDYSKKNENLKVKDLANSEKAKKEKERYLYILHKIGVVYNWSVSYFGKNTGFDIELTNNYDDIEHIKFSSEKYILPYLPEREYINKINSINSISELKNLILIVRNWYFSTFVKTRKEQIANMISFVDNYKNKSNSESIQNELEKFFDISSLIDTTEEGADLTFENETIEDVLIAISNLKQQNLNSRRIEMERLIESISNIKIDMYLSLINLRLNLFETRNGRERLLYSLNNMKKEEQVETYQKIYHVYNILDKDGKIKLLDLLFEHNIEIFNNVLLENLKMDYVSTLFLIKSINTKLVSIV